MNDSNKSESNRSLWRSIAEFGISSPRERRNKQRFTGLCLVWALTLIGASWAMTFGELQSPASWLVALIPIALGIVTVFVYVRMLREMDEMMRKRRSFNEKNYRAALKELPLPPEPEGDG